MRKKKKKISTINKNKWIELSARLRKEKPACEVCGKTKHLQCHHITGKYYRKSLLRFEEYNIIVLCPNCHYNTAHKSPVQFIDWLIRNRNGDYMKILNILGAIEDYER